MSDLPDDKPRSLVRRVDGVVGAVFLALLLLFGTESWHAAKADQTAQLRTVAELSEKAVDRYFEQLQLALGELAQDIQVGEALGDLAAAQRQLGRFKDLHTELLAVNLLDLHGQFLATSTTTRLDGLPTVADQRDFERTVAQLQRDKPMELTRPLYGPAVKRWVLPIRYTVRNARGEPLGFLVAAAPVEMLRSFWSQAPLLAKASIGLVLDDGYLISRYPDPPEAVAAETYGQPRDGVVFRHIRDNGFPAQGYVEGPVRLAGADYGNVFVRFEHYPVTLVAGMPLAEFRAAWWGRAGPTLVLAALLAAAAVALVRHSRRREQAWAAERLLAEQRLRASEQFLEQTGALATIGGWALDADTKRLSWTRQTYRIHELDEDTEPTVDQAIAFYTETARDTISAAVQAGLERAQPWDLELPMVTARGRAIWVRAQGRAETAKGRVVRLVGAVQDITEYRQRRTELQKESTLRVHAEMQARALDRLLHERMEILDVLAHEVRQPLNNASAALQAAAAALSPAASGDPRPSVVRAQTVLGRVLSSIDNTLAVAALLASPDRLHRADADIDLLVATAIEDLPAASRPRVRVLRDTRTRTARFDFGLLRLALRNALSNALKYSPADQPVQVRVSDLDQPLALVLAVEDAGPGFEPELLPKLFSRGTRGAQGSGQPGHGLGLYIVKRVMDLHGGSVQAENRPAGGAVVRLVINQAEAD
jgi:signal transduction histidine kinase